MNPVRTGVWRVRGVSVNSSPAGEPTEFYTLISSPEALRLEPAGVVFRIQQATTKSAVLESRSQIFFADFTVRGDVLELNLSRPEFSEMISLQATFDSEWALPL